MTRQFILVGHCGPDAFMLRQTVQRAVPDAAIEMVNDAGTLQGHLNTDTVLLVNRALDGAFATDNGVELIRGIADGPEAPIAMLVSNFEDAQAQAEAAGASPGFGKSQLYDETTIQRLREAAGG